MTIVEDEAIVRDLLVNECRREFGYVVSAAATGRQALEVIRHVRPTLAVIDLCLPDIDGFTVVARLQKMAFRTRVLIMSARCDPFSVHMARVLGVRGYLYKQTALTCEFGQALQALEAGGYYFSARIREVQQQMRADPHAFFKLLTERQQEILSMIAELRSDAEIGAVLSVSAWTVEKHRFRIMRRLGLTGRNELQRYARDTGFVRLLD